ncbi:hypothetical protein KR018_010391, partial [Drosophila ironensis]
REMHQPAAGGGAGEAHMPLKACNTASCKVSSVAEKAKRKCSQFVSAPQIMKKPLFSNGNSAIFQVGGKMANMSDIPSLSGGTGGQPIYRIKPGTHAHIINYVVVDEGSDSLEKAKSGDQEAMRLLLDSQRDSAASKLQKLVDVHRGPAPRSHPNFAIVSVEGSVPFASSSPNTAAPAENVEPPEDPGLSRLQAEILELRRTVARLQGNNRH